ncbi:hypothetical protein MtrunA17_Chr2g0295181 [Medicago truncatula]|uniref:Transmembrane protein, putative n=1 Tax=Medicago truncatula TaxID=3880 RepID=G7INA9_MEDTR|nr:transmembrane protein, putative [Medicago truncatula]RHN73129.1 hypothetical protein MtrunA17_Chr2g0295181 [Medicago truncatula]
MAKFISASIVLVLLVVTTMINGAYSAEVEVDGPFPPELQKLCDDWFWKCNDDPHSVYCHWYNKRFCSTGPVSCDYPPKPESTLP